MNSNFISQTDYLIKFTKDQKDIIKRIKDYAFSNCRIEILQIYRHLVNICFKIKINFYFVTYNAKKQYIEFQNIVFWLYIF